MRFVPGALLTLLAAALITPFPIPAFAVTLGVIGDSLSDEYIGHGELGATDLPALSWTQLVAENRDVDLGAFEPDPDVRGNPRFAGYEHVWARSGATVDVPKLLGYPTAVGQAQGLVPAITTGQIDAVFFGLGSNDFAFRQAFGGTFEGAVYETWVQQRLDTTFEAIDLLLDTADVHGHTIEILLAELPPGTAFGADATVLDAIAGYNEALAARASSYGITPFDLWAWVEDPDRVTPEGVLKIGGHVVPVDTTASLEMTTPGTPSTGPCDSAGRCATLDFALNFISSDGLHPNTIVQGMLANELIRELNGRYPGLDVALLSDDEILASAAVVPEPGTGVLVAIGLCGLGWHRRRQRRHDH